MKALVLCIALGLFLVNAQRPASLNSLSDTDLDEIITNRTRNRRPTIQLPSLRKAGSASAEVVEENKPYFDTFWQMAYFLTNDDTITKEEFVNKFTNYGCHCFVDDAITPGGKSVVFKDNIDQLCRNFALCRQCIDIDSKMDLQKVIKIQYFQTSMNLQIFL